MSDAHCWRCNAKLFVIESATGTIIIKCDRCKASNRVTLDKAQSLAG